MKREVLLEKIMLILYTTVFLTIIFFRNVLNINVPIIITTVLIISSFLLLKKPIEVILAFLIPFASAIQGNYVVFFALIIFILKNKSSIKFNKNTLLIFQYY